MRSLFQTLILAHLLVIVVTILTFAFIFSTLFYDNYRAMSYRRLEERGQAARRAMTELLAAGTPPARMYGPVRAAAGMLGGDVFIVDRQGRLISTSVDAVPAGQRATEGRRRAEAQVQKLTLPLVHNGQHIGTMLVAVRLDEIDRSMQEVQSSFLWATLLAIAVAVLVSLVLSRRVSTPLRTMQGLAEGMARGDFSARAVEGRDEVGRLAASLNRMADDLQRTLDELHQEQRRLGGVLAGMAEGVVATDSAGRVILANPQAQALLDLEQSQLPAELAKAMGEPVSPAALELEVGERLLHAEISPLAGAGEWGAVAVLRDVSDARRLEEMRRRFVSDIGHELRTPLTSMAGFVTALGDGTVTDDEGRRRSVEIILKETARLNRLINDLMDLSRIEAGALEMPREPLELRPVLESAAESLSAEAAGRRVTIEVALPDTLPPVCGHRDRLYQVVVNLLANAIRFNRPGGKVTLRAGMAGEGVKVEVQDTGVGIPAEELERIWDRFHRVERSRSRSRGGTGLGLAIAKHIVEAHGGEIGVTSAPGQGSTFWFTVPRAADEEQAEQ